MQGAAWIGGKRRGCRVSLRVSPRFGDWEGVDLIYTGRGKRGDQALSGQNLQVAENRARLLIFEAAGTRQLRYLGQAVCRDYWWATGSGEDGNDRRALRFRLEFGREAALPKRDVGSGNVRRRGRPFDPSRVPAAPTRTDRKRTSAEEILALQEQANTGHHRILSVLSEALALRGWTEIEEIPGAIDLWAIGPDGQRTIFEAKTMAGHNEVQQSRAALGQLLEYRYFYGSEADQLCLVTDRPIGDARSRLLASFRVGVLYTDFGTLKAGSLLMPPLDELA
jgi:hypothetical protein